VRVPPRNHPVRPRSHPPPGPRATPFCPPSPGPACPFACPCAGQCTTLLRWNARQTSLTKLHNNKLVWYSLIFQRKLDSVEKNWKKKGKKKLFDLFFQIFVLESGAFYFQDHQERRSSPCHWVLNMCACCRHYGMRLARVRDGGGAASAVSAADPKPSALPRRACALRAG